MTCFGGNMARPLIEELYRKLNELPDKDFEDIIYGSNLPSDMIEEFLDDMTEYLQGENINE